MVYLTWALQYSVKHPLFILNGRYWPTWANRERSMVFKAGVSKCNGEKSCLALQEVHYIVCSRAPLLGTDIMKMELEALLYVQNP